MFRSTVNVVRFKTNDAKTSLLFHNDLCQDHGSITVTLYNAGMLITELELEGGKTTMSAVFLVRLNAVQITIVAFASKTGRLVVLSTCYCGPFPAMIITRVYSMRFNRH